MRDLRRARMQWASAAGRRNAPTMPVMGAEPGCLGRWHLRSRNRGLADRH
jgi:hypothetical protein